MIIPFLPKNQFTNCQNILHCADSFNACAINLESVRQLLDEEDTSLASQYLAQIEQKKFNTFRYEKRRVEWLGGRIAAKEAIRKTLSKPLPWQDLIITPDQAGRPYISCNLTPVPDISISHSDGLAVAIASKHKPCGVDIQNFTPTIIKVQERFASFEEIQLIREKAILSEQKCLTLLWTAKEALRKAFACVPLIGFKEIILTSLIGSLADGFNGSFSISREPFRNPQNVYSTIQTGYACSITFRALG